MARLLQIAFLLNLVRVSLTVTTPSDLGESTLKIVKDFASAVPAIVPETSLELLTTTTTLIESTIPTTTPTTAQPPTIEPLDPATVETPTTLQPPFPTNQSGLQTEPSNVETESSPPTTTPQPSLTDLQPQPATAIPIPTTPTVLIPELTTSNTTLSIISNSDTASPPPTTTTPPPTSTAKQEDEYTCQLTDLGKRVHESKFPTQFDCVDTKCKNTCKGGQCVAYVKCRCTKKGKYPPNTGNWKPGRKVQGANGKCNRDIANGTAIATFTSANKYDGHAAVFIRCVDDNTVQVYDQWCSRSVGYSKYPKSHGFYSRFATIRSSVDGPGSIVCRSEVSGSSNCPACVEGC